MICEEEIKKNVPKNHENLMKFPTFGPKYSLKHHIHMSLTFFLSFKTDLVSSLVECTSTLERKKCILKPN